MAYQTKSYRKFVATAATAALVASAVAPAASAASVSQFKDVAAKYQDAVKYLVDNGITEGTSKTTFGTYDSVKRGDAAVWIAKALKLDTSKAPDAGFKDVNSRVAGAVNALYAAKIISGKSATSFAPDATLTRGEMAKIIANAYNLESNKDVPFKDLGPTFGPYIKALYEFGITTGTSETTFGTGNNITRGDFAIFLKRASEVKVNLDPVVASVNAINATQVEVKFSQEVDKTDAERVANYSINGTNPASASLGSDKKTVTLTFASQAHVEVTNGVVVVEPVTLASNDEKTTEKWTSVLTYKDTVKPEIVSVKSETNGNTSKSLTVEVSEPVVSASAKVNGEYYTITFDGKIGTITGLNLDASKTHTLELINLTDKAGTPNVTVSTSKSFNVTVDKVAPTATLSAYSDKAILVTFSKPMNVSTVQSAFGENTPVKSESLEAINSSAVTTAVADSNDTKFIIPITTANIYANKNSRTFHVVLPNTLEDKLGNKLATTTQSVTLTKDTVKPAATGYKVIKNPQGQVTAIEVNFSEGLAAAAQGSLTAPTIVDSNGRLVNDVLGTLTNDAVLAGDKKVVFKAGTPAKLTGKYAFSFAAELVSDLAETPNKSNAFNYTIDFGSATTTFELRSAGAAGNIITVNFGRAVKGGAVANSATDVNNYSLAGKPLPAGTTIVLDATQTEATITLPSKDSVQKDDPTAVFTVANVHSLAGEVLKSYTGTVAVTDNTAPVVESAKVLDNKTIELTYSEAIQINDAATNNNLGDSFVIKQNDTELDLANAELTGTIASGFDKKLVLKIVKGSDTPATPARAEASGPNYSIVELANETSASANETVNYKIVNNGGTLEVRDAADDTVITTLNADGDGSFDLNGVTVNITGGADTNTFTIQTVAAVPASSATTLDLSKDITIETKAATPKKVVDKSVAKNEQKAAVKVTVVKP